MKSLFIVALLAVAIRLPLAHPALASSADETTPLMQAGDQTTAYALEEPQQATSSSGFEPELAIVAHDPGLQHSSLATGGPLILALCTQVPARGMAADERVIELDDDAAPRRGSAGPCHMLLQAGQQLLNIGSDVMTMAGGYLYIKAFATDRFELLPVGAGLFAGSFTIDAFRQLGHAFSVIRKNKLCSDDALTQIANKTAHTVALGGLCMLASGQNPALGCWLLTCGAFTKGCLLVKDWWRKGLQETFGNDRHTSNVVGRIFLLTFGGCVGSVLWATGSTVPQLAYMQKTGAYILSGAVILGTCEVLLRDCQEFATTIKTLYRNSGYENIDVIEGNDIEGDTFP